ncbi:PREDICTED: arylsulfatase D-like [Condylura cristata]|uniref:arylsulfatase D-like n=1 Tax=Condylura cristata TaxID=143302 RepID=UPI000642B716|nr:PREDICTED: arylsulfatase D-like [Condylura cristata]
MIRGATWKVHYVTPRFHPEGAGACYGRGVCPCSGDQVDRHDPPLLFDLSRDPSEAHALTPDTEPMFHQVIDTVSRAVERHRQTLTPVPLQLDTLDNVWKPWLQPCCGSFPMCWCDEEDPVTSPGPAHDLAVVLVLLRARKRHSLCRSTVRDPAGEILNAIEENGLKNTTFTYFTSDHGGHLEARDERGQLGGWNGIICCSNPFVPLVKTGDGVCEHVQVRGPSGPDSAPVSCRVRVIDGRSLLPLLQGTAEHSAHEFLFHYCGKYLHAARWHEKDTGRLWKVHYTTPRFHPEGAGACYGHGVCPCSGDGVTHHHPPLLFDLSSDPSEAQPLSPESEPRFQAVVARVGRAVEEHRKTLSPAPPQFSLGNIVWKPWLQPCCGTFPFCSCEEDGDPGGAMPPAQ